MKRTIKKAMSVLLVVLMLFATATTLSSFNLADFKIKAEAATYTGSCGKNLTYYLSSNNGALTIVGDGDMYNYHPDYNDEAPWVNLYTKVKSVVIQNGVTSIGENAFFGCDKLSNVTIAETVTKIGAGAFSECGMLENINIPASVTTIECSFAAKVTVDPSNPAYSSDGNGVLYNKDKTELVSFPANSDIESYTIPATVTKLSEGVFTRCKFSNITIPASVKYIDYYAFQECVNLKNVYYTGSISDWCSMDILGLLANPMYYADTLNIGGTTVKGNLVIPEGVTAINAYSFVNCAGITGITLPNNLKSIGNYAFTGCTGILNAVIPDSVTELGEGVFSGCTLLESVVLPSKITSIKADMFNGCEALKTVNISLNVSSVCDRAFENCKNLATAYYPGNIANWNGVTVGYDNYYFELALILDCNSARPYFIPGDFGDGLTWTLYTDGEILISGDGEMADYEGSFDAPWHKKKVLIKAVAFGDGITDIGAGTFTGFGNITAVTIPKSVKNIGLSAFGNCDNLAHVYYEGSKSDWNSITIAQGNEKLTKAKIHYNSDVPVVESEPVPDAGLIKKPSTTEVKYGETLILHINATNIPDDAKIEWSVEGEGVTFKPSADGKTCAVTSTATGDVTVTAKYVDSNGVEHVSEQEIESKAGLWQKIISFFKNLFGMNRIIEQRIKFN